MTHTRRRPNQTIPTAAVEPRETEHYVHTFTGKGKQPWYLRIRRLGNHATIATSEGYATKHERDKRARAVADDAGWEIKEGK